MYATVHRVVSPRGEGGVNAFVHEHGVVPVEFDWSSIDRIASRELGELVAECLEVVPAGGNRVLSYLEVACPDDTPADRIVEALAHMQQTLDLRQRPSIREYPPNIVIRFDYVGGLGEAAASEFEALRLALEDILRARPRPAWMDRDPLVVVAERRGEFLVLRLDDHSRRRVANVQDVQLPLNVIHVDLDVLAVFERVHGDLIRQVLPSITGLPLEQVREQGGARVVRAEDQRLLWEWPQRS